MRSPERACARAGVHPHRPVVTHHHAAPSIAPCESRGWPVLPGQLAAAKPLMLFLDDF
jgi:predicted ATPase with chaperone activity